MIQRMNDSAIDERCWPTESPVPACTRGSTGLLLSFLGTAIHEAADDRLAVAGLNGREYSILSILETDGPGSQAELARLLGKVPAMVVLAVDSMEASGIVARERDPDDRRRTRVVLTPRGRRTLARAHEIADETVAALLPGLSAAEREQLHALLVRGLWPS
jgi:MarR family transcriptional regulator, lower aerobic nicotinate degradation pathway regulator